MKKRIRLLAIGLCLMLTLSACQGHIPTNETSGPTAEPTQAPTTQAPTAPPSSAFLDSKQPVEGRENLFYLPGTPMEDLKGYDYFEMYPLGENLLIHTSLYAGDDLNPAENLMVLSLADGSVINKVAFDQGDSFSITTRDSWVLAVNNTKHQFSVYDETLALQQQYSLPLFEEGWIDDWMVSPDLKTLYVVSWNQGIHAVDLAAATATDFIPGAKWCTASARSQDNMILNYIDGDTQRRCWASLNTATGKISPLSLPESTQPICDVQGTMLLQDTVDYEKYHLVNGNSHLTFLPPGYSVSQINASGHLFCTTEDGLSLYDQNGEFLSCVRAPQGEWIWAYNSIVWLEDFHGYLLICQDEDSRLKLYFWDISIPVSGDDLIFTPYDDSIPGGEAVSQELYDRAKAISEQYGVDIRIADQCQLEYSDYTSVPVTDENDLTWALDGLENALSAYPEGYFGQLRYGDIQSIRIELIQELTRTDWPEDAAFGSFNGFAQEIGNTYLVVVDIYSSSESTYFHEFSHITDNRLSWDAMLREDALYSEDTWTSLQPEEFSYSYSYSELPEDIDQWVYTDAPWFLDSYSCTYPTEDRARIMEYAMMGWNWDFQFEPLYDKLDYLSLCIRDCFDTTGWPEVTAWEAPLFQE